MVKEKIYPIRISKLKGIINTIKNNIYVHNVLGKKGKPMRIRKIKTMYDEANTCLEENIIENGLDELGKPINGSKVIPGRQEWREYFKDEIPQLYNVYLRRDMKLVGVRPKPESVWSAFPKTHKQRALKYKPGLCGVQYAHDLDCLKAERKYLAEKKVQKIPFTVDIKYFCKIWYNIIFKGKRSC